MREQRGGVDGRQRVYEVTPAPLKDVQRWIAAYQAFWPANLASLKQHLEAETYRTHDWQVDTRVGGEWSARTVDPSGQESTVRGEYLVIDPPYALAYAWRASWDDFAPTTIRYELAPALVHGVVGTRLTVTHTGLRAGSYGLVGCATVGVWHATTWEQVLEWLAHSSDTRREEIWDALAHAA